MTMDKIGKMEDLKKAIIEKVNQSEATNPLKLYSELLVLLYCVGYRDGQDYVYEKEKITS